MSKTTNMSDSQPLNAQPRVLVCDHIDASAVDILKPVAQVTESAPLSEDALIEALEGIDVLLVRSQTKVTARVIESTRQLKMIARAGVGVDNIDLEAATRQGIMVVNSPSGNTMAAAEHTLGLMFALARYVPAADQSLRNNEWKRKDFLGSELNGKVLGIVGLGKIGTHVARVAHAMNMQLVGFDPFVSKEQAQRMHVELLPLQEVFARADYLSLHVPNTPETHHMINAESIAMMKDGVRIINCARGQLVDSEALAAAVKSGKVAGAALDVFEQEPLIDSPLQTLGRDVILTPHLGASTKEAQVNVARDVAEQAVKLLQGESVQNAINIPSLMPRLLQDVQPYFPLAENLGSFLGQLQSLPIERVEIEYVGELADKNTEPLKVALLRGLLKHSLPEQVNYVNALYLAQERGIEVNETQTHFSSDYTNLISLSVYFDNGEHRHVAGSIIGEGEERIVHIDHFPIGCIPAGHMLVVPHPDKPGMIGVMGELLGDLDINISGIQLGRHGKRGPAVMVINVDEKLDQQVMKTIQARSEFAHSRLVVL